MDAVPLAKITPAGVKEWQMAYLAKAGQDELKIRAARNTANSLLRALKDNDPNAFENVTRANGGRNIGDVIDEAKSAGLIPHDATADDFMEQLRADVDARRDGKATKATLDRAATAAERAEKRVTRPFVAAKARSMEQQKGVPISAADKARSFLESQIKAAEERMRIRRAEGHVNSLPVMELFDAAVIVAGHIAKSGITLAELIANKVELGLSHLTDHDAETVYNRAEAIVEETRAEFEAHAKQAAHDATPEGTMQSIKQRMSGPRPKLEAMDHTSLPRIAKELAKAHVLKGERDVNRLNEKIHADIVKELFPEVTLARCCACSRVSLWERA